MNKVVHIAQY